MTRSSAGPSRILLPAMFAVYLLLLGWIILWKLEVPHIGDGSLRVIKVVPFVANGDAGASAPLEIAVNVLLFVPLGAYLGLLAPAMRWGRAAMAILGVSLALEALQYALALGSSDITDLIANTTGGLLGIGVLTLMRRAKGSGAVGLMVRACIIVTVVLAVLVMLFVLSPLRFAPPPPAAGIESAASSR
ncbi:VanZ family protein [Microbacterium sp. AGC85]